jgi:hypothetical protein
MIPTVAVAINTDTSKAHLATVKRNHRGHVRAEALVCQPNVEEVSWRIYPAEWASLDRITCKSCLRKLPAATITESR